MGVTWYFIVVLVCIFLHTMSNDIEHHFMYLLETFIHFFKEKCLFISFAHFYLDYLSSIFWILVSNQKYDLQIFSPTLWVAFLVS